jgi:hypothetical protein
MNPIKGSTSTAKPDATAVPKTIFSKNPDVLNLSVSSIKDPGISNENETTSRAMIRFLYPIFVTRKTLNTGINSAIFKRANKASLLTKITSASLLLPHRLLLLIS